MPRKLLLACLAALVVVLPATANEGNDVSLRGVVVRASTEVVSVENDDADLVLTCRVPERLAAKVAALKVGDKLRITCRRTPGRRAELIRIERVGERAEAKTLTARGVVSAVSERTLSVRSENGLLTCSIPDRFAEKVARLEVGDKVAVLCKQVGSATPELQALEEVVVVPEPAAPVEMAARGTIAELGEAAIIVVDAESGRRLACRVSAERRAKLVGLRAGDVVKLVCLKRGDALELVSVVKADAPAAGAETRLLGTITAVSRPSVTVEGDGHTLTCSVPASFGDRIHAFAVGDRVKLVCRGSELASLERA